MDIGILVWEGCIGTFSMVRIPCWQVCFWGCRFVWRPSTLHPGSPAPRASTVRPAATPAEAAAVRVPNTSTLMLAKFLILTRTTTSGAETAPLHQTVNRNGSRRPNRAVVRRVGRAVKPRRTNCPVTAVTAPIPARPAYPARPGRRPRWVARQKRPPRWPERPMEARERPPVEKRQSTANRSTDTIQENDDLLVILLLFHFRFLRPNEDDGNQLITVIQFFGNHWRHFDEGGGVFSNWLWTSYGNSCGIEAFLLQFVGGWIGGGLQKWFLATVPPLFDSTYPSRFFSIASFFQFFNVPPWINSEYTVHYNWIECGWCNYQMRTWLFAPTLNVDHFVGHEPNSKLFPQFV